eukprot:COSAG01_NODE_5229_length_4399_cov_36.514419_2_plen_81_part_00
MEILIFPAGAPYMFQSAAAALWYCIDQRSWTMTPLFFFGPFFFFFFLQTTFITDIAFFIGSCAFFFFFFAAGAFFGVAFF